jgi:hypothetical protein
MKSLVVAMADQEDHAAVAAAEAAAVAAVVLADISAQRLLENQGSITLP